MEFCVYCLKNVDVTIEEKVEEITWKGEKFSCVQKYARCKECGKLVDIGELHDFNLFAVYDAYREKKDIISYADVIALTEKYKSVVSIRNLSKILGMGEHTLERYCDRCIPTKTFSHIFWKNSKAITRFYRTNNMQRCSNSYLRWHRLNVRLS